MTLSLMPKDVKTKSDGFQGTEAWFYEEKQGLEVVVQIDQTGEPRRFVNVAIPWRSILASVRRYEMTRKAKK